MTAPKVLEHDVEKIYRGKVVTLFEGCLNHSYAIYKHFNYSALKINKYLNKEWLEHIYNLQSKTS